MIGLSKIISIISMNKDWLTEHANESINLFALTRYIMSEHLNYLECEFSPSERWVKFYRGEYYTVIPLTTESTNIEAYQTIVDAL